MKFIKIIIVILLINQLISSCNSGAATGPAGISSGGKSMLTMKINGREWTADNDIYGAVHPIGYDKLIMIAGSIGPKNKDEQTFNINIYNAPGPGLYHFITGDKDYRVAQLANLSPENYLYGGILGYDMKVNVTKASSNPTIIEATFEGTLNGNASDVMKITDGKFYYHE